MHYTLFHSIAPLPFHALSNLLTLFSHEVPTLPLIQHVWDFLLCREPLAVVWLAVAVSTLFFDHCYDAILWQISSFEQRHH
jgi:hypothetical protein